MPAVIGGRERGAERRLRAYRQRRQAGDGLRATVDPYTYVASGVGGDVTVAAQTKHKVGISISVSGSMAESDDTRSPPAPGSTSTGPAQESGKYDAKYAKVGAAVGFAYSQVNTEVFMDGVIVARRGQGAGAGADAGWRQRDLGQDHPAAARHGRRLCQQGAV